MSNFEIKTKSNERSNRRKAFKLRFRLEFLNSSSYFFPFSWDRNKKLKIKIVNEKVARVNEHIT